MPPAPPPSPAGNEFPPVDTSWSRSALSPTPELPTVWRVEQVLGGAGMWQSWGNVIEYQTLGGSPHRDVRPGTSPAPPAPVESPDGTAVVATLDRYSEGLPAGFNPGDDGQRSLYASDSRSSRYGVSGVISAADEVDRVEEELDFTWLGSVEEQGGMLCFRAGSDAAPAGTFDTATVGALS